MSITTSVSLSNVASGALFFLVTALSGILLSHLGKPFNTLVFTVHKLSALATVFLIVREVYGLRSVVDIAAGRGLIPVTAFFFVVLIVTGALLGLPRPLSLPMNLVHTIHQLTPLLALVGTVVTVYLLGSSRS